MNKLVLIEQLLQAEILPQTRTALLRERADNCQRRCPGCRAVFLPRHGGQRYCSLRCAKALWMRRYRARQKARATARRSGGVEKEETMHKLVVIEQLLQANLLPEIRAALLTERAANCQRQ